MSIIVTPKAKSLRNSKKPRSSNGRRTGGNIALYHNLRDNTIVMRVIRAPGTINTNGSSVIVFQAVTTNSVFSQSDFTTVAASFQNYRVSRFKMTLIPTYPTSYAIAGVNCYPIGAMWLGRFWDHIPTTDKDLRQSPEVSIVPTNCTRYEKITTPKGFASGQLWNDTTGGISAERRYGFAFTNIANTANMEASAYVFNVIYEFDVQFMGMV